MFCKLRRSFQHVVFKREITRKIGHTKALITGSSFTDRAKAEAFERYLNSASGHAFARKHLW